MVANMHSVRWRVVNLLKSSAAARWATVLYRFQNPDTVNWTNYIVRSLHLWSMERIKVYLNKHLTHTHTLFYLCLTLYIYIFRSLSLSLTHTNTHSPLSLSISLFHAHTQTHSLSFSFSLFLCLSHTHTQLYTVNWINYVVRSLPMGSMESIKVCLNRNLSRAHSLLSLSSSPSLSHTQTDTTTLFLFLPPLSLFLYFSVSLSHTQLYIVNCTNYVVRSLPLGSMERIKNSWKKIFLLSYSHTHTHSLHFPHSLPLALSSLSHTHSHIVTDKHTLFSVSLFVSLTLSHTHTCTHTLTHTQLYTVNWTNYILRSLPLRSMERIKFWIKLTHTQRLSSLSLSLSLSLSPSHTHTNSFLSPYLSLFLFLSLSHTQSYTEWTEQIMLLEVFRWDPWKQSTFE